MFALAAGVVLFVALHLLPMLRRSARAALTRILGELPYRALFAVGALIAVGLMVWGWRVAPVIPVYAVPRSIAWLGTGLAFAAVVLFLSSVYPSRLRRWVRHPQLAGVALWSAGHLLHGAAVHGLVLFGGLGAWALTWAFVEGWGPPKSKRVAALHLDLLGLSASVLAAVIIGWVHGLVYGNLL